MNQNPDIAGGAGEQVADILDNIPSDRERGRFRFRRPAPFDIFLQRRRSSPVGEGTSIIVGGGGEQTAGEEPEEERRIGVLDVQKAESDIYNISGSDDEEPIDPLSRDYVGIVANYFSVGLMVGGSTSLLYPVLVVRAGATSSLMSASIATVMLFWSYKIFFGFLSDCFPVFGYKRKPYIAIGVSSFVEGVHCAITCPVFITIFMTLFDDEVALLRGSADCPCQ